MSSCASLCISTLIPSRLSDLSDIILGNIERIGTTAPHLAFATTLEANHIPALMKRPFEQGGRSQESWVLVCGWSAPF